MMRHRLTLNLAALAAALLAGCNKTNPTPDCYFPAMPSCYSGTVVANTCMLGTLVNVDPAFPIGKQAYSVYGNRLLGNNVVAVANSASLRNLNQVGQRLHFTYTQASKGTGMTCQAADGTTTPVPFVTLSNVSTVSCDSAGTN